MGKEIVREVIILEQKKRLGNQAAKDVQKLDMTMQELNKLVERAKETHNDFLKQALKIINKKKAEFVRKLRVDEGYTWRAVAQACFDEWGGDWRPSSNQLMGMAICEVSAKFFNEQYMDNKWN